MVLLIASKLWYKSLFKESNIKMYILLRIILIIL